MGEWQVVLVIISLVGFVIGVVTPLIKLNSTITELNVTLKNTNKIVACIDEKVDDHEHRITILESRTTNNE